MKANGSSFICAPQNQQTDINKFALGEQFDCGDQVAMLEMKIDGMWDVVTSLKGLGFK